jgi:FKBP-type peptidyl-prolyl cis-trans isomerase 2
MTIADEKVVTIEYTLETAEHDVIETSRTSGPITFRMGDHRLLPGLAAILHDMEVGQTRRGTIPPGQLVPVDRAPQRHVSRQEFPQNVEPGPGDRFEAHDAAGKPVTFEVVEVDDDAVVVRVLHPLHDQEVLYEVTVVAAKDAPSAPA